MHPWTQKHYVQEGWKHHYVYLEIWEHNFVFHLYGARLNWYSLEWVAPLPKHLHYMQGQVPKIVLNLTPSLRSHMWWSQQSKAWFCRAVFCCTSQLKPVDPAPAQLQFPIKEKGPKMNVGAGLLLPGAITVRWSYTCNTYWDIKATSVWGSGSTQSWCGSRSPTSRLKCLEKKLQHV